MAENETESSEPTPPDEKSEENFTEPEFVETSEDESQDDEDEQEELEDTGPNRFQKFRSWYLQHKKKTVPATLALILVIVLAIPASRYALLGLMVKKSYVISVMDLKSNLPVSEADVTFRGRTAKTGVDGKARINGVAVGPGQLEVSKKYYKNISYKVLAPLKSKQDIMVKFEPTGRQVPIKAINKITGKPVAGGLLDVSGTQVKTNDKGEAVVVLPPEQNIVEGTVSAEGYNEQKVSVKVSHLATTENTFSLVPAGKLYFLSKRTGQINVMKSDLDGSNAKVVLSASGHEEEDNTILLASRDWKYLALKSRREGNSAKLYLIDTADDKLTEIDGGNDASVNLVGWSNHRLVYQTTRNNVSIWQNKRKALKSYDAASKKPTVLDESVGEGISENDYAESDVQLPTILADRIVYINLWVSGYYGDSSLDGKKHTIISVKPDGSGTKQTLKDFDAKTVNYVDGVQSEVDEIYYRAYSDTARSFYTYENGKVEADSKMTDDKFNKPYPTFLVSPTGESTFWFESRDGKNTLLVGDSKGQAGNEIAALSEYTPYGWYTDNYVFVSKNNSELYIMPSNGPGSTGQILKVTDYHKPSTSFYGYGYGYGGF